MQRVWELRQAAWQEPEQREQQAWVRRGLRGESARSAESWELRVWEHREQQQAWEQQVQQGHRVLPEA